MWLGKLTVLDMTPLGWLGRKTSTQTNKQTNPDGSFELISESLGNSSHISRKQIFRDIKGKFPYFIMKMYVDSNEYTQHTTEASRQPSG